jgi:hypothetical protein
MQASKAWGVKDAASIFEGFTKYALDGYVGLSFRDANGNYPQTSPRTQAEIDQWVEEGGKVDNRLRSFNTPR